eukprot:Em0020g663a
MVENDNRLVQEGHQTNENGGDPTANECGQALNAKPNDEHCSPIPAVKEPEETIEDIEQQIENCQKRLDAYKEEKHVLFQELKKVLHDEDERKKHKELEQKQEIDANVSNELEKAAGGNDTSADIKSQHVTEQQQSQQQPQPPAQPPTSVQQQLLQQQQVQLEKFSQAVTGVKRSLPTSPELGHPDSGTPLAKHHRGPLLPNPDTPIMFGRSGGPYMSGPRRPYGPRSHYGGGPRQVFHDPRFSQSHVHLQEIHGQGLPPPCPVTPTTPHAMSFPHLTTVPEFHGSPTFQFVSSPQMSPFVNTETSQQAVQGGYVSKHPADIQGQQHIYSADMHLQLQSSHSSDPQLQLQTFGHQDSPHFLCQPTPLFGDYIQGGAYIGLDPRHQKLEQPLKLESPPRSPVHSSRKHSISRGLSLS